MKSAAESKLFSTNKTLNIRGRLVDLSVPRVMGVLNVTPDSFYDGGRYQDDPSILKQVGKMLSEGATFIDVGAYSSRPGADDVSPDDELNRAVHTIQLILREFPSAIISIDTFRSSVALAAANEGAAIVNDISGGALDPAMIQTVASLGVPYIVMHMRGNPQNMTTLSSYQNLIKEITDYFHEKIFTLQASAIKDIIIDPGFGFAKNINQNFAMLNNMDYFGILDKPIMVGISRKSMIWKTLSSNPDDALNGTTALNTIAILKGANILRVHDVKEAVETIQLVLMTQGIGQSVH